MDRKAPTTIVYLTGRPGVGKYTIAQALSKNNGFIICDNQLINNPIFELLQYDGYTQVPDFAWDIIGRIRQNVFEFLMHFTQNSYVLTNNLYEDEGDRNLYDAVKHMAQVRGSLFVPIRLLVTPEVHLKRVVQPERRARWKSIDPQDVYDKKPLLSITHPHFLELDVSYLTPEEAALQILRHVDSLAFS